jgi:hypothetical protein
LGQEKFGIWNLNIGICLVLVCDLVLGIWDFKPLLKHPAASG